MKTMNKLVILILAAMVFTACAHSVETRAVGSASPMIDAIVKRGELWVGTVGSMPPLNFKDKEGKIIGLEADLATLMAASMGVKVRFKTMAFFELLPALESGQIDMILSGMTMTPQRNLKVAFVGPYYLTGKSFLTKRNTIASVKDPSEINSPDTVIAALRGSTSQAFVETFLPKAKLILTRDHEEALQMVLDDRVHAMIADHHICIILVLLHPNEGLVALAKPLTHEPIGIALPGNDPLLINWVENFMGLLQGSGDFEKLRERWFKDASWFKQVPPDSLVF